MVGYGLLHKDMYKRKKLTLHARRTDGGCKVRMNIGEYSGEQPLPFWVYDAPSVIESVIKGIEEKIIEDVKKKRPGKRRILLDPYIIPENIREVMIKKLSGYMESQKREMEQTPIAIA